MKIILNLTVAFGLMQFTIGDSSITFFLLIGHSGSIVALKSHSESQCSLLAKLTESSYYFIRKIKKVRSKVHTIIQTSFWTAKEQSRSEDSTRFIFASHQKDFKLSLSGNFADLLFNNQNFSREKINVAKYWHY